ncbi:Vicilin-like seed storage protein [Vitis vinifera]|uniref:Vicilin-like seed storage protein n=1 Tax=Vitis vinifera TaxID=29760 RepID=A0A438IKV6_VITVI|nr:Vicilin-like seed storage protein [Vitis vinifera]
MLAAAEPASKPSDTAWLTPVALISLPFLFINCFFSPLSSLTPLRSGDSYMGGVLGHLEGGGEERQESEGGEHELFLMHDSKQMVKTDAGEMRVVRSAAGRSIVEKPMHIGFITMEPKSLFVPQYLDSSLILFIRRGEAKVGSIYNDQLVEKQLKIGDLYTIPAGSAFYLVNTGEGQRLHIICSIDMSESLKMDTFQSFFLGEGHIPHRFSLETWDMVVMEEAPELYMGWSIALDESDYSALADSGVGIYSVNLTAGSMMAPHLNPTATEIGIVLKGSGHGKGRIPERDISDGRQSPFEFFGFTTSARQKQATVPGRSQLAAQEHERLRVCHGLRPVSEDKYDHMVNSQREAVILPSPDVSPPVERKKETGTETERVLRLIKGFGND